MDLETLAQQRILSTFIKNGRLVKLPAKHTKRLVVLEYLAGLFEVDREYPEREVNQILGTYHPDVATLSPDPPAGFGGVSVA